MPVEETLTNSILDTVKKMVGLDSSDTSFDLDIITLSNATFNILQRMGYKNFNLSDSTATWSDYFGDDEQQDSVYWDVTNMIKTYIPLKVRFMFDPPAGTAKEVLATTLNELEWSINVGIDGGKFIPTNTGGES